MPGLPLRHQPRLRSLVGVKCGACRYLPGGGAARDWRRGPMALCFLDLDGFKEVNDRYGHNVGDERQADKAMCAEKRTHKRAVAEGAKAAG